LGALLSRSDGGAQHNVSTRKGLNSALQNFDGLSPADQVQEPPDEPAAQREG
jgi:hypothetical protein